MSVAVASRREALRGAALGAGALALGGLLRPVAAGAQSDDTVEALRDYLAEAIALEQISVLAYANASEAKGTDASLRATLELLRDQEQAHANAFRQALDDLGYDPPEPPDDPEDSGVFDEVDGIDEEKAGELTALLARLAEPKDSKQFLELLRKLERGQISFYAAGAPEVESEDLATTSAEIVGAQAQHLLILAGELGEGPLDALDQVTSAVSGGVSTEE